MGKKVAKVVIITCLILIVGVVFVLGQINKAKEKKETRKNMETETVKTLSFGDYPSVEINEDSDGIYEELPTVDYRYEDIHCAIGGSDTIAYSNYHHSEVYSREKVDEMANHLIYGFMELLTSGNYNELFKQMKMNESLAKETCDYYCDELTFDDFVNEWENIYGKTEGEWYMTIDNVYERDEKAAFALTVGKIVNGEYTNLESLHVTGFRADGEIKFMLGDAWHGYFFGHEQLAEWIK